MNVEQTTENENKKNSARLNLLVKVTKQLILELLTINLLYKLLYCCCHNVRLKTKQNDEKGLG